MSLYEIQPGDVVYAAHPIHNDGSIPGVAEDLLLADQGTRGVVVNVGHVEFNEDSIVFLVRFEAGKESAELGPAVGCWPDDLSLNPC